MAKKKPAPKLGTSSSARAVAEALPEAYPKDAEKIIHIMLAKTKSGALKYKLERVQLALAAAKKEAKQ